MIKTAVLVLSDTRTKETDESGKEVIKLLKDSGNFSVISYDIEKDEYDKIKYQLEIYIKNSYDLVLTSGGTGLSLRDVTPEATLAVCDREIKGIAELMRVEGVKKTKKAVLSRGIAAQKGRTLIVNLPGSKKGACESLEAIIDILPHAVDMMKGKGH